MNEAVKRAKGKGISTKTINLMKKFLKLLDNFDVTIGNKEVIILHDEGKVVLYDW